MSQIKMIYLVSSVASSAKWAFIRREAAVLFAADLNRCVEGHEKFYMQAIDLEE